MQRATHPRLHVRDARDAHTVFEAVRQGLLRPVVRRLNEVERSMHVRSGSVFVWEETEEAIGLRRVSVTLSSSRNVVLCKLTLVGGDSVSSTSRVVQWTDGLMVSPVVLMVCCIAQNAHDFVDSIWKWSASRMREPFLFYESKSRGRSSNNK